MGIDQRVRYEPPHESPMGGKGFNLQKNAAITYDFYLPFHAESVTFEFGKPVTNITIVDIKSGKEYKIKELWQLLA